MENMEIESGTPTQVVHTWRTAFRTLIQGAVGALVAWLAARGVDLGAYEELLVGTVWTFTTGLATWVMNHPRVNRFIERYLPFLATGVHTETQPIELRAETTADGYHLVEDEDVL